MGRVALPASAMFRFRRFRAITAISAMGSPLPAYPSASQAIPVWREF
jgi:hypothetical protein